VNLREITSLTILIGGTHVDMYLEVQMKYRPWSSDTKFYRRQRKVDRSLTDQQWSTSGFYENTKKHFLCEHKILTEIVFLTQLSSHARIWVWRIVWVTTNCCFISDVTDVTHSASGFKYLKKRGFTGHITIYSTSELVNRSDYEYYALHCRYFHDKLMNKSPTKLSKCLHIPPITACQYF
jgi:hypothetical protein